MYAVVAAVVFYVTALLALVSTWQRWDLYLGYLVALMCVGLGSLAVHLAYRVYRPNGRW